MNSSIVQISEHARQILSGVKNIVRSFQPSASLYLYGSAARRERTQESDYDILVLTDNTLSTKEEDEIIDAVYDLELEYSVVISLIFYTEAEWQNPVFSFHPFHQNVEKDAIFA